MNARRTAAVGGVLGAAAVATLAVEAAWVVRRPLPALEGHDASLRLGPDDTPPIRLVVLGDSTTTGPGLAGPEQIWLHRALAQLDLDAGVDVRSLAVGGSRVADVLGRLPEVWELEPDAVVVAVGSNDAIHATPVRRFARDMDVLVAELTSRAPAVAITNIGDLGNLERVPPPLTTVLRTRSRLISRRIEAVVAEHPEAILIDVTAVDHEFRRGGVFGPDLFHPNEVGHELWASAAIPGLAELLGQVPVSPRREPR